MKTKKTKTAPISDKLISELRLMVKVGATPIECVNSFNSKISRSTVYKLYNKIKTEADGELKEASEELKAVNVSSEVTEEPVSEIISEVMNQAIEEQFEEELKDGDIVEHERRKYRFVYSEKNSSECCFICDAQVTIKTSCICNNNISSEKVKGYFLEIAEDKCMDCDVESAHIINELSAKNEELQKELHTSKNVIVTLQKMTTELNEAITESKIAIQEVCEERDDKDEEIRLLNLELQKYKNDIKMVIDDRQKLECLLSDNANTVELNPKYDSLYKVLLSAYNQASNGKGKERHQLNDDEPFENQKICEIARRLSTDYNLGQAVKKIYESNRLPDGRDIAELYGAINYIAAAIIVKQEAK